ncbi:ATP-dependent Clp protease proteolytic subunit [Rhodovulum sulfidophilum]|uniref:head maturation protease, ClpP-related n=2 Tax=Rhodovulum sulfidophilum TaxID=35806 RepID=UPI001920D52D|nr:head maturation protease, ClpP-related [Rhodovulum sulfidophilum]MBL3575322.1 ATP-dependent Clp protease proteolytic subunit [Rhodovulum sulfidophilum]MCE8433219.1 ATP-dependent Clp protease proteolytic subunit [Rhodovulum sulfidophilum]MCF4115750.1 ATP-dependent Clp protease proteolytic subunit [Rhodovulum sulfidophilum]
MEGSDLILNGEIILEGDVLPHEYCSFAETGCFSARMVREALARFDADVTLRVNSPGGCPCEGEAIRAALEAHPGRVTVIVSGFAASAASLMIMSAGRIEMTAGSFLMIHNPSRGLYGTAADLRKKADDLDKLARIYASVYAARSGRAVEDVMRMMDEETYFGPEDAVAAGFADAVSGTAPEIAPELAAAMSAHRGALSRLRMCARSFAAEGNPAPAAADPTGPSGSSLADPAATEEIPTMTTPSPAAEPTAATVQPPAQTQPQTPAPTTTMQADAEAMVTRAVQAERERARSIRSLAQPSMRAGLLSEAQVEAVIDEGVSLAAAGNRLMAIMAAAEPPIPAGGAGAARITRDETDTHVEGLIAAMMRDYSGPGEQFREMGLKDMVMHLASPNHRYRGRKAVADGFLSTRMMGGAHGVSDFAYITTEVMNRYLIREYDRRGATWQAVAGEPRRVSDFREVHGVRFGGDLTLKDVKENGEYEQAMLEDQAEGLKLVRRGRTLTLTFDMVMNDDLNVLADLPNAFARHARRMENDMVWALIRTNAKTKSDGKALFHADHGNLAAAAGQISVATVGAARKAMWEQTAFGSKDAEDFLQVTPDQLIVPPALETVALQFATATTPVKDAETNPFKGTLTPFVVPNLGASVSGGSDSAWYLVSSELPPISVAYLDGYETPTVQTVEGMNPDKVTMNARHIFGAAPTEFRGAYRNPGK